MHGIHDNYLFDRHHWPESLPDRDSSLPADRCGSDPAFAEAFGQEREEGDTRPAIRKACA